MKCTITWPSGLKEVVEKADCATLEHFVTGMFGRALSEVEALGTKVEEFVEEALGIEEPDAEKTDAEKTDAEKTDAEKTDAEKTDADTEQPEGEQHG